MKPKQQRTLPLRSWPEADCRGWAAVMAPGGGLLDAHPAAHLALVTLEDLQRRYGCFLEFCQARRWLKDNAAPASAVTEPNMRAYIEFLHPRLASVTVAGSVRKILRVASLLAPTGDWGWLRHFANRLEFHMQPHDKRPDMVDVRRLYRLGIEVMNQADAGSDSPWRRARRFRDGLIIALLAASALRLGAFVRLENGKDFSFTGSNWNVQLPGTRGTKYPRPIEKPLPPLLTPRINRWVSVHKPRLHGRDNHQRLWPSGNGTLTAGAVHRIVCRYTRKAFGHRVNPHLFRDCAVTTIFTEFSAQAHLGSAVLDHVDPKTTRKHYNQARMVDAVKIYQRRMELRD